MGEAGPGSLPLPLMSPICQVPPAAAMLSPEWAWPPTPGHASLLVLSPWPSSVVLGRPLSTLAGPSPRGHTGMLLEASLVMKVNASRHSPRSLWQFGRAAVDSSKAGQRDWEELEMKTQLLMQADCVPVTTSRKNNRLPREGNGMALFVCWGGRYLAAAAESPQSCLTLCDPIDGSPPGSPVPGIPQARTLEWVAVSFSNA